MAVFKFPQSTPPAPAPAPASPPQAAPPAYAPPPQAAPPIPAMRVPVANAPKANTPPPGVFAMVAKAQASGSSRPFLPPGVSGWFRVDNVKADVSRKDNQAYFAVDLTMIADTNALQSPSPVQPGHECGWFASMKHVSAPGNVKAFIMAATGASEEQVDENLSTYCASPEQPLKGAIVQLRTVNVPTRAGNPFTKHVWDTLVPFSTVAEYFAHPELAAMKAKFWPDGELESLVAQEAAQAAGQ
jgi:hypothetical protein